MRLDTININRKNLKYVQRSLHVYKQDYTNFVNNARLHMKDKSPVCILSIVLLFFFRREYVPIDLGAKKSC